jgi:uncharacterized repeat protein (TIGR02543 family)
MFSWTFTFDESPVVKINGIDYFPYTNGGWYKVPVIPTNAQDFKVTSDTLYWSETDTQIYLLYNTAKYSATYYVDDAVFSTADIEYNTAVPSLKAYKTGYKFAGWYLDAGLKTPAPTLMPPYAISLYAKWE